MGKAKSSAGIVDPAQKESARLVEIAVSKGLLSRSRANPKEPLRPCKALLKCDGLDIVKKGNRKIKYLFSFPGLVSPVSGGKFGDLVHLDTRNPVLYIDFPQGRLKLFGTIVYPKSKYLVMQIARGSKGVLCEDSFEALIVFSETWWIGRKEENPEELKLEMPKDLQQKHTDYEFTTSAGCLPVSSVAQEADASHNALRGCQSACPEESAPIRQSLRTSGRKRSYVEVLSDEDGHSEDDRYDRPSTSKKAATADTLSESEQVKAFESRKRGKTILDYMDSVKSTAAAPTSQKKQSRIDELLKRDRSDDNKEGNCKLV